MKPITVNVDLGPRSYPICIGSGLIREIGSTLSAISDAVTEQHLILITDGNVAKHYLETVVSSLSSDSNRVDSVVLPPGESTKSVQQLDQLWQKLVEVSATRQSIVIALGGGVIGDLAGFAAATFNRGIRLVQIPTTLLAQVDSSVGGKTGINLPQGKNLVGAFHQPRAVLIDPDVLKTLDPRDYRSGLAEVVKYGAIMDPGFFQFLEDSVDKILAIDNDTIVRVIRRCCECKAQIVFEDETETSGRRAILNYGHTFGHAIENAFGYGRFTHGEAISIGMTCAARLAVKMGRLQDELYSRQTQLLQRLGLPVECPDEHHHEMLAAMQSDKKVSRSGLNFLLPTRMGDIQLVPSPSEELILDCLKS